ncbi:MAG: hypothetical protein WAL26_12985 [Mycobacterium sp.]
MCYPVSCRACGKTGWDGCGQHVDEVMRTVPVSERCTCRIDLVNTVGNHASRLADVGARSRP